MVRQNDIGCKLVKRFYKLVFCINHYFVEAEIAFSKLAIYKFCITWQIFQV